jgi:hypothetical protein
MVKAPKPSLVGSIFEKKRKGIRFIKQRMKYNLKKYFRYILYKYIGKCHLAQKFEKTERKRENKRKRRQMKDSKNSTLRKLQKILVEDICVL